MAGLGKKTFVAGEVLRAADVNGYLMDQAVMNFAGTAARGSAIGSAVSEGMVTYLADINQIEVYDGSSWKNASSNARGLVGFTDSIVNTSFAANTFTVIQSLSVTIYPSRRYKISAKIAVQPSSTAGSNSFLLSEASVGARSLAYETTAIGANLCKSFDGFYIATSAQFGVTSGSASKTVETYFRCGSAGAVNTNPDAIVGTNSFVPQLVIEDIGAS